MARDIRDLRDPQKLGEAMISHHNELIANATESNPIKGGWVAVLMSDVYDSLMRRTDRHIPDYDHGETLVKFTVREYWAELKRRAEAGDRHAADTLRGIPNDEPIS